MSYQVIARKYRPQRFEHVVGQEHVTVTLANAIRQSRIAHAYLFCGPRGTGKTTIARIFAKCLNCTGGPNVDFADDDPKCAEIAEGRSLDVLEIDGASNRGIDEIRDLRETVKYAPATSKFKIYIIDEVHMLTKEAFNALLKTLEEPPAHVKFMFATTEPEKVLPTILSRCQRFDLRRIPTNLIVKHLTHIAGLEKIQIDSPTLYAIARGAEGGLRDAESTLDQLISFCGERIEETDVLSMFGLTARAQILALTNGIVGGDTVAVLRELNDLASSGKDLSRLVSELLNHFRNLLIYQVSGGDLSLLEASEQDVAIFAEQSPKISTDALTRIMEVLADCETRLRDAVSKKILIEVALMRAIEARGAVSIDSVLRQLQQLRGSGEAPVAPAGGAATVAVQTAAPRAAASPSAPVAVAAVTPLAPARPTPPAAANAGLDAMWGGLIEGVGRASPFARSYLAEAFPISFEKNILTIGYDAEFADTLGLVDNAKNRALFQTKLGELGHPDAHVKFIVAERPANLPRSQPAPAAAPAPGAGTEARPAKTKAPPGSTDDFKNDPLIKQALEIFKGQIVDVRT